MKIIRIILEPIRLFPPAGIGPYVSLKFLFKSDVFLRYFITEKCSIEPLNILHVFLLNIQ
jgi:hypothetical protein